MSSLAEATIKTRARGHVDYVRKPFRIEDVIELAATTLAGTKVRHRAHSVPAVRAGGRARSLVAISVQTQLSHQTKKYDLKSKHCGAQSDLGTTRAKVVEALTEVRRAKIDGPALIFDDQLCELHSSNTDASTSASAGQCQMSSERAVIFSTTNRHWPRNPAVFWGIPGVGCVTVGKLGQTGSSRYRSYCNQNSTSRQFSLSRRPTMPSYWPVRLRGTENRHKASIPR